MSRDLIGSARRRRGLRGAVLIWLLVSATSSCATSNAESEPPVPRSPEVAGLAPLPMPSTAASTASNEPSRQPSAITVRAGESAAGNPALLPGANGTEPAPPPSTSNSACIARVGARALKRAALMRTLDAGLGTWLRGVDVEGKLDRGRFQGWLIHGLYRGDSCWVDVDLREGDVVTRINRRPIERPEEAQAVWTALRGSSEIVVEYLRDARPRTLRFAIVD